MEEIAKIFLDFFSDHDVFSWLVLMGLGIVLAAFVLGSLGDIGEEMDELKFWLWLRKNDNFAKYRTFPDARRGMIREKEEREYERATRRLRRRMEKRRGKKISVREKFAVFRDRLYSFCDRMLEIWDSLAAFASRTRNLKKPEDEKDGGKF